MNNLFELKGKIAIVTGGNGGIGFGMAKGLVSSGATVVVAARNSQKSADAVAKLEAMGGSAVAIDVDVTSEAACKNLIARVAERFGRIDILANNAGINIRKQPELYTLDEWKSILDINLQGAFLLSKEVYPHMAKQRSGKIINTGSMTSIFGAPFAAAYGASKGGIVQLSQALASAWAKDNIQVNAILPGWIDTNLTIQARKDVPTLQESVMKRTPAGRWGRPDDLSGVAVFLASAASDFITGAAIPVDGGYSAMA